MREEALEIKDAYGGTPLGYALKGQQGGNQAGQQLGANVIIEMTKYMVEKNKKILSAVIPPTSNILVVEACVWKRWELVRYLYSVTPLEVLMPPVNGSHGASLIWYCLNNTKFGKSFKYI